MKKHAAKACLIGFEILAIVLATGAAGAAYLYWRLERGPISLDILKPSIEFAISNRFPDKYASEIDRIELSRQGAGNYAVQLVGLTVYDQERIKAASATQITSNFSSDAFFSGAFGPETIEAKGVEFRIVRNREMRVEIPAAPRRARPSPLAAISPALSKQLLRSAFQRAEINDAVITFHDVESGRSWRSTNAGISLTRTQGGLLAEASGDIDLEGAPAALVANAQYTENSGVISVELDGANFPIGDILTTFYGDQAAIIEAPVSGKAVISLTTQGKVLSSRFAANVDMGFLNIGGRQQAINFIKWDTTFNPDDNRFEIEQLAYDAGGNKGVVEGSIAITFENDARKPESISFALTGSDLVVNLPGFLPGEVPVEETRMVGAYRIADRRLALHRMDLSLLEIAVGANVIMAFPRSAEDEPSISPEVRVNLAVDGDLDPQRLLRIWPLGVAMGARDWIEDRVETAVISNIDAIMDLPAGAIGADGLMPDETMTVTFDVSDAKAYYVKEMTPLTGGSGKGLLRGNSFILDVDRVQVGDIKIDKGEVEFPVFIPKWQPTYIRFSADGRSQDMLSLLDQAPLRLLSKINLQPDQFEGNATARVEIMRPNKRDVPADEYRYSGTATFDNMEITGLVGDVALSDAKGEVELRPRSMTVNANASLSEAPISMVWRQNFFKEDGASTFKVSGSIDSSTGDLFGVASRQYVRGPIAFDVDAVGELGAFEKVDVNADFTDAALMIDALGWRKPMGASAKGIVNFEISPEAIDVRNVSLEGEGMSIAGNLTFTTAGALQKAHVPRLYLKDAADISITMRRNDAGEIAVNTVGEFLNAGPMIEAVVDGPKTGDGKADAFNWGPGLSATARINSIRMRDGIEYRVAALDLWRDATSLKALDFTAFDHDGPPMTVNLSLTGEETGPRRTITAQSGAIGALLQGVFGLTSVNGGEGSMLVNLKQPGEDGIYGQIEARNLKIVGTPLLARIFSAGSLDGLSNLLNNEGIDLSYAYGEFDFTDGILSIDDMRATGPSVGITADGAAAIGEGGDISLNGAIAPVYQLNSILGNAPIIGDILVGKKGEGILALSYTVSGERSAPTVLVNPLSALTPGIFRRLFEPQDVTPKTLSDDDLALPENEASPE